MAGSKRRERELARQRYERQQAKREAARLKARRRQQVVASALAVLAVIGGIAFLSTRIGDGPKKDLSAAAAPPSPSPSPTGPAGKPTGDCSYQPVPAEAGAKVKNVGTPPGKIDMTVPYTATIKTNLGVVTMDLWTDKAPCAVNSFKFLADRKFYDNTPCHRMLVGSAGNVLQCGDPSGTGSGGPGYQFAEENLTGAKYPKGVVAMAKGQAPGTSGSQFFLNFADSGFQPDYTPFGKITSGLDVLVKISKGGVDGPSHDHPKTKVIISQVVVAKKK